MVSVVVLTYNQEQTIGRTLDSILSQKSDYSFEIIVGEDASPSDNTRAVCESYAAKHPQLIRLLPKAPNKGLMRNYADCLAECSGKYIACCAGDDWWHNPNKLQMQVEFLEANLGCVLVYTNYDIFQVSKKKIIHNALPLRSLDTCKIIDKLLLGFFLPSLTIMYRREMLSHIDFQMYIDRGYMAEDLPMFLTFALHGKIHCIEESTSTYSAMAGSISHFDDAAKMERFMLNMRDIKLDFLSYYPFITSITKQQIVVIYNNLIFNGAFASSNRDMMRKYYGILSSHSFKDFIKFSILTIKPLFWAYQNFK